MKRSRDRKRAKRDGKKERKRERGGKRKTVKGSNLTDSGTPTDNAGESTIGESSAPNMPFD